VKHPFDFQEMFSFLAQRKIAISDSQKEKMIQYLKLLRYWTGKQNLVSKNDIAHIVERHFFPSLFFCISLPQKIAGPIIDIGSGGGFPGVLIKIMRPEQPLTLLDSSRKKVLFLEEVCDQLDLDCTIVCQRCEIYSHHASGEYHIAVARAVAALDVLWYWTEPLLVDKGALYAFKGGDCDREIAKLKRKKTRIEVKKPEKSWQLKSTYMQEKCIVVLEK
jgi:16S rRNA (guanine527-N7)-methyltransferase